MLPIFRAGLLRLEAHGGLLWLRFSVCELSWDQVACAGTSLPLALCLCSVTLPLLLWEDSAVHLQLPFYVLAGIHRICTCLHFFSPTANPAHFPYLKKLLLCTCRTKHICLGGVRAVCTQDQPSREMSLCSLTFPG